MFFYRIDPGSYNFLCQFFLTPVPELKFQIIPINLNAELSYPTFCPIQTSPIEATQRPLPIQTKYLYPADRPNSCI
jgi:hypothetical protein